MTQAHQLSLFEQTINYQNTQTTLPKNFQLTHTIGKGGIKTKAAKNIEAIKLSKKLDQENRHPTPTEQQILAEYLGWGIAPEIFEEPLKPSWEHLGNQLKALLTPTEYQVARKSIINAYYTTPEIIQEIYQGLKHLGFSGSRILEPSMGCGLFLGLAPTPWNRRAKWTGIELDSITGSHCSTTLPGSRYLYQGF